jgi:hypothetical protein
MKMKDKTNPLKDKPLRNPGQSLDEELDRILNEQLLLFLFVPLMLWIWSGMEWFSQWRNAPRTPAIYAFMAAVATIYCGWRIRRLLVQVRAVRLGRDGERIVGQSLEELREGGARVFHDVVANGFNLDHVIVSERGIFAIETKTWSKVGPKSRIRLEGGRLYKDGILVKPNPIQQAAAEANWLRELLRKSTGKQFAIQAVVLFPGWWIDPMDQATKEIAWVLNHTALPKWIQQEAIKLAPDEVHMVSHHLDRHIRAGEAQSSAGR